MLHIRVASIYFIINSGGCLENYRPFPALDTTLKQIFINKCNWRCSSHHHFLSWSSPCLCMLSFSQVGCDHLFLLNDLIRSYLSFAIFLLTKAPPTSSRQPALAEYPLPFGFLSEYHFATKSRPSDYDFRPCRYIGVWLFSLGFGRLT